MANLNDDYEFIQKYAMNEKQIMKWINGSLKLQKPLILKLIRYLSVVLQTQSG